MRARGRRTGRLKTNGGRVFDVVGVADNLEAARKKVYGQIDKVTFEGARYRARYRIGLKIYDLQSFR